VGITPGVVSRALRRAAYGVAGVALHVVVRASRRVWCVGVTPHGATGVVPHGIAGIVPRGATGVAPRVVSRSWSW